MMAEHCRHIPACVALARLEGVLCDMVIRSWDHKEGGWVSHHCHASVLAAVSPLLRGLLGDMGDDTVIISEVGGRELLGLLYQGEVVCEGKRAAKELWDVCADLGVEGELTARKINNDDIGNNINRLISPKRGEIEGKSVMHIMLGVGSKFEHKMGIKGDHIGSSSNENSVSFQTNKSIIDNLTNIRHPAFVKETVKGQVSDLSIQCPYCRDRFSSEINLQTHIADIHTVLHCRHCGFQVKGNTSLVNHLARFHSVGPSPEVDKSLPSTCRICWETLVTNQALKFHLYKHTGVKPYKCEVCGSRFRTPSTLKSHVEVQHTDTKNKCNICGLKSSTSGKLKIHMRIHTNEKPYQCAFCPISFKQQSVLKVHEFIHTKKSNYRCEKCGVFFPTRCRLVSHRSRPVCVSRSSRGGGGVSLQSAAGPPGDQLADKVTYFIHNQPHEGEDLQRGGSPDSQLMSSYQTDSLDNLETGEIPVLVDNLPVIGVGGGEKGDELTKHDDIMFSL